RPRLGGRMRHQQPRRAAGDRRAPDVAAGDEHHRLAVRRERRLEQGGLGVEGGGEEEGGEQCAFHLLALSIAPSTSSHIPPLTAVTNLPFASYTPTYGSAAASRHEARSAA